MSNVSSCEHCGGSGLVEVPHARMRTFIDCGYHDRPICWHCDKPIVGIGVAVFEDSTDERAHKDCNESAHERAYDRMVEDFYGSSSLQTMRERYDAAATEKRRMS